MDLYEIKKEIILTRLISKVLSGFWIKLLLLLMLPVGAATYYLDDIIRSTFTEKKWSIPSTVYARPLEIYQGAELTLADLKTELKLLGYHFVTHINKPGQVLLKGRKVTIFTPGFQFSDEPEPARKIELTFDHGSVSQIVSSDNAFLVRLEPVVIGGIYPSHHEDRLLVQLSEVPESLQKMLVAVEDNNFYHHYGISLRGIGRALLANIKEGEITQGASTLTQQLIKNYYLTSERTLWRKMKEALMAMLLEVHFSKEDIL